MIWSEVGSGVHFAAEIPLQVVPPAEPVELRVLVDNQSFYPMVATLRILQNGVETRARGLRATTGDLPGPSVFDATYPLKVPVGETQWKVVVLCQPSPGAGVPQAPWKAPDLQPDTAAPPPPALPSAQTTVMFRNSPLCPRCEGRMRWSPARSPKPRGWVCEDCAHRVESGMLN